MEICVISDNSIALSAQVYELEAFGISSSDINIPVLTSLMRRNFDDAGLRSSGDLLIETYINSESILIFAQTSDKEETMFSLFSFSEFEHVLSVCALFDKETPSVLVYCNGKYYLHLHVSDCKPFISEFGENESFSPLRIAYLCEHGQTLFPKDAIGSVKRIFNV